MTPTGCKMRDRVMTVMATGVVSSVGVLLEVLVVVVWQEEAEAQWCVTTVTKMSIYIGTVGTPLRHVGIAAQ